MFELVADIESDGLLEQMTTIHSLCLIDVETGEQWSCTDHPFTHPEGFTVLSIDEGLKLLMSADTVTFHNGIKFDIPAIQKIKPWFHLRRDQIIDTLILSRLIWPEIKEQDFALRKALKKKAFKQVPADEEDPAKWVHEHLKTQFPGQLIGSHGLEAWGYRLGEWKGDYSKEMKAKGLDPWAHWNIDMQLYCDQDVVAGRKLLQKCRSKNLRYAEKAIEIERDFAIILAEMERNGFPFHQVKAADLQRRLMRRHMELTAQLADAFPPKEDVTEFIPKVNNSKLGYVKGQPVLKRKEVVFNPSSRQHIARWLKEKYGWKPKAYTETGQPVIDEKVLKALKYPEAKMLAEYFLLDKRLGMLEGKGGKGLIPYGKTGTIHGQVMTNGAVTRRCTHSKPNMAQLPAINVPFGKDFRELMYAPDGWSLLGWDASGLELRCFAHYMNYFDGGAYTNIVLDGDIHWTHAQALSGGKLDGQEYDEHNEEHAYWRNKIAKRFIYAFLYGAGAETIGEIVNPTGSSAAKRKAGQQLINTFLKRTPALKRLKETIAAQIKKQDGKIISIDGGAMHVRSAHAALNTLLQSAGAIAVKVATILFYDKLIEQGLVSGRDFRIVAHVHDEVQTLVRKGLEDVVGRTAQEAMREAGEALGFRCPLAADYKHGGNWAETH
ncbi:DNA polymerase [Epibacterium sp. MM17-32]|uniref:DNA polymerase n=1 Tax=Epibacterium sp. MM17-32 TaxID=2917734 RepID=UPI001EF41EE8|nr:DNA polymerase [Epibacterium sp. MM17-32]MCG7628379.1 DNA polymerase [Epibacterium sp. MM17-32]